MNQEEISLFTSFLANYQVKENKELNSLNQVLPQAAKVLAEKGEIGPVPLGILEFLEKRVTSSRVGKESLHTNELSSK